MTKSIAIIGGGIAGLSAGVYAQMNGFRSSIYERNDYAGGLCTSWDRKDYRFDGCIHWLTGTDPSSGYYKLWKEIGCVQDKEFYYYDYFTKVRDRNGRIVTFYNDPDRLEEELLSHYPEDHDMIRKIRLSIRTLMKTEIPVDIHVKDLFKLPRIIREFYRFRMSPETFAARFRNPGFRETFTSAFEWHGMSLVFNLWAVSLMASQNGGYPIGGSSGLIRSVVERYESLGGKIHYGAPVSKILARDGRAEGILLENGEEIRADYVLSAADGHRTIYDWLEGKYTNDRINRLYRTLKPFPPLFFVSLGVQADYSGEPYTMTFLLKKPFSIGPDEIHRMSYRNHFFDPTLAPRGKSILLVMNETNYDYWESLYRDRTAYEAEKKRIAGCVIDGLAEVFPALPGQIEVMDVATPMTFVRYSGNWRGSYEGWLLNSKTMLIQFPQKLPGLSNFFMAGHWISPGGGLPSRLITGRKAIKMICKKEKLSFKSFSE
jgi:phytoene dehydrogenase-like protein